MTGLGANPMYEALTNLLAAVLKTRTSPAQLPGLEAMMPRSPLARMLNRRDVLTAADLHVLGGDLAVRDVWSALKALATAFFYLEDHDLVVNTPSMLRGTPRTQPVKYFIDTDGDVSHFNYFRRADTAERLAAYLSTGGGQFRTLDVPPFEVDGNAYQKRGSTARPTVVLVPRFMGTHLSMAGGRVWADPARLAQGAFAMLAEPKADAQSLVCPYADRMPPRPRVRDLDVGDGLEAAFAEVVRELRVGAADDIEPVEDIDRPRAQLVGGEAVIPRPLRLVAVLHLVDP